jgi:outer membrane protein OmpA-like peptidoglycan-associated protein
MRIPIWILALVFLGYTVWAVNFWHCYQCQCCGDAVKTEVQTTGVPLFNWNGDKPVPDAKFQAWKKALLAKGGQGDTLVITGYYRADEANGPELGLARAAALRAMMAPEIPESRVRLASKLVADDLTQANGPKESADFSWSKMVLKKEAGAIIEADNAVTFLFPFKSTEKDKDPAVEDYLKKLVEKHKSTTATFTVVGHTDNVGDDKENLALGLARAKSIAKFLTTNGIAANRIKVDSKGKAESVADNNTEDGRHQNRRVVITVNR